ncbi:MAG: cation:proton antiporter, partial [Alphaproteobacteria bacterium]|nr:cation:proton antiporter [Alphaproteobacteria bacterium]
MDLSFLHESPFSQLAALLMVASILGLAALRLKQPLIIAFIGTGLLVGPGGMGVATAGDPLLVTLSELGIALLLFMVGLKLDLGLIKRLGVIALIVGMGQVILTTVAGAALCLLFGFEPVAALFIGLCLAFSSTIIVVKILTDSRAIDSLYGRIALGVLIVQDFVVILAMVLVAGAGEEGGKIDPAVLGDIALRFAALAVATGLFMRFAARHLARLLARDSELMIIAALGLAAGLAALCHHMGLGRELGGLLAGIALASTP